MIRSQQQLNGSALVETAILMVVLAPVIFGIAMVGKLIDLNQAAEQAGRYAAWEATVYPEESINGQQAVAIKERFFGEVSRNLSTNSTIGSSNQLKGDPAEVEDGSWYAKSAVVVGESTANSGRFQRGVGSSTVAMQVGQTIGKSGNLLGGFRGNTWGLSVDGLLRSDVGVKVKRNYWLQEADPCFAEGDSICVNSSSVILVDNWSASSDTHAKRRVRSLVPASALQPLGDIVSNVGYLPVFRELRSLDGAFGHVNMEVLPEYAQ